MPAWIAPSWDSFPRLLLQAGALFVAATFVFDAIHFTLHWCLNSRHAWLRRLARPHLRITSSSIAGCSTTTRRSSPTCSST